MRKEGIELVVNRLDLVFKKPAKTSRDTLLSKPSWILIATDQNGRRGWGECSIIPGLSLDEPLEIERVLSSFQRGGYLDLNDISDDLPALRMAIEMVLLGLENPDPFIFYGGAFARGERHISINGLIWMDEVEGMMQQAEKLISSGFQTLKLKVGSMPFAEELAWLKTLRELAPASAGFTLRVDANGAFSQTEAGWTPLQKLEALAELEVHSIEQPLRPADAGLAELCRNSPVPVALDESLIGLAGPAIEEVLDKVRPHFLVLKPSLLGGFSRCQKIIDAADERGIRWWITSALESNLGLNAIAQWTADGIRSAPNPLPQGLGTGGLFLNNVEGPLLADRGLLQTQPDVPWVMPKVQPWNRLEGIE